MPPIRFDWTNISHRSFRHVSGVVVAKQVGGGGCFCGWDDCWLGGGFGVGFGGGFFLEILLSCFD